jgi:predicted Zn-dependent protease
LIPLKFLQFSRGDEREADYLGLQYLYKTGYDPQALVDFFEKIQAREKSRSGSLAKAFSTHPMTSERIKLAQEEMNTILPARDEYLVTSSEFDQVVGRLRVIENRGRMEDAKEEDDRPTLRRRTTTRVPSSEESSDSGNDEQDRPTLKRPPQ